MGERKVLNKYYPPDFDPAKIPRRKMPKDRQYVVRLMAPFNMRCLTCGEYIYKGKKFNAMKETVLSEEYLGLKIFRFYIRCTRCCAEIAFKTDPKNTDYVCELGATRNFENWREEKTEEDLEAEAAEAEANPMAALESRTEESRREMDILDALEEIKDANARNAVVDVDSLINERVREQQLLKELEEEEDAEHIRQIFSRDRRTVVKRLSDDEDEDDGAVRADARRPAPSDAPEPAAKRPRTETPAGGNGNMSSSSSSSSSNTSNSGAGRSSSVTSTAAVAAKGELWERSVGKLGTGLTGLIKSKQAAPPSQPAPQQAAKPAAGGLLGLGVDYGSDDSD